MTKKIMSDHHLKSETFAGSFQQILSSILENDTFHINNDRKISNNAKN